MNQAGRAAGRARRARTQGGIASLRVLIALTASSVVTVGVAVPLGYQAYQANQAEPATAPTVPPTDEDRRTSVAGATTTRPDEVPSLVLPPLTTEQTTTTTAGGTGPSTTRPPAPPTTRPSGPVPGTPSTPGPTTTSDLRASTTATTPPTTVPIPSDGLVWTSSRNLGDLRPLQDATLSGEAWILFDDNPADILQVVFWLDDPEGTGPPANTERMFPYSLVPGRTNGLPAPLDTTTLPDGGHSVRATVQRPGGTEVRLARFTVDNG